MSAAHRIDPAENETYKTAITALRSGISVVAIRADGSKTPVGAWGIYKTRRATEDEIERWYTDNPGYGLGFVCGKVSGNLELLDFDSYVAYEAYKRAAVDAGLGDLVERIEAGYCEMSPKPGMHWFYRCETRVDGNTKLAQRPKRNPDGTPDYSKVDGVLIETRGEGGQGVVAPSGGTVHTSGKSYRVVHGSPETIATITTEERDDLLALARSFDEMPPETEHTEPRKPAADHDPAHPKPGEDFNQRGRWEEILGGHGWSFIGKRGRTILLRRPGKDEGISATINHLGTDRLHVFTSSTNFEPDTSYSKFAAYAMLEHGGSFTEAARDLSKKGYGDQTPIAFRETRRVVSFNGLPAAIKPNDAQEDGGEAERIKEKYNLTDDGNWLRFVQMHGDTLRYVNGWDWLYWNGMHWAFDETGVVMDKARETVKSIYGEAKACEEADERKALAKWAMQSESRKAITAFIDLAQKNVLGKTTKRDYDADPMLFNVQNGTIDLRTGELRAHDPNDLITRISPVTYDPTADCPVWIDFLFTIMGGRTGDEGAVERAWRMVDFLQRLIGYTISGVVTEEIVAMCIGVGGNGKSKMVETVLTMMGGYGRTASFDTFLESRNANGGGAQENILKLMGARFVKASEPDAGKRLNTSILKDLTGGETVTARGLYEKRSMDFLPQFTLWLSANHKPEVKGQDNGIWRRIKLIPFDMVFVDEADIATARATSARPNHIMIKDPQLGEKLRTELPGILAWAVRGCIEWQQNGLQSPPEVELATKEYKAENDVLGDFFSERCIRGKGQKVAYGELFREYTTYCEDEGQKPIRKKSFKQSLEERGLLIQTGGGNLITVYGLGLLDEG